LCTDGNVRKSDFESELSPKAKEVYDSVTVTSCD